MENDNFAFPQLDVINSVDQMNGYKTDYIKSGGMTLRDYFAAKAMQGLLPNWVIANPDFESKDLAYHAYDIADAMLKEREKMEKGENNGN